MGSYDWDGYMERCRAFTAVPTDKEIREMSKLEIERASRHGAYIFGWRDGSRGTLPRAGFLTHEDEHMREAYAWGYDDGKIDRETAYRRATELTGHTPSVVRQRCGIEGCQLAPEHAGLHKFGGRP